MVSLFRRQGVIGIVLLAVLRSAEGTHNSPAPTAKVALAIQGGGFRSHVTNSGLIAGLLKFVGDRKKLSAPDLDSTGLLHRFDTVSSVSGGSWFFSQLAYSEQFQKLIAGMAASVQTAADQFNKGWFDPFKKATHVDPSIFNLRRDIAEFLITVILGKGDEDTLFAVQFILATNSTWNEFVKILLTSTSSINDNMTLASPVGAWAKGKYWFVDHTLLLPSKDHRGFIFAKDRYQTVTYESTLSDNSSVPLLLPAKFSMKLGEGCNSSAPFRYIAGAAVPTLESFEYQASVVPVPMSGPRASSGPVDPVDLADKALVHKTGSLPIWGPVAASSAFIGLAPVFGADITHLLADLNHADITPWVSRAPGGASFQSASELVADMRKPFGVSKRSIDALAAGAVHGVIDGGYSDGTGLGQALAEGAEEVLVVLNSGVTTSPFYLEVLCKDGPNRTDPFFPKELLPLFETPASSVNQAWSSFERMTLPIGTKYLTMFVAGTIQMTTIDNKYFGITGGRTVTVHVVHIAASLDIGFLERYTHFGSLVQEIAMAINAEDNKPFVENTLLPMFCRHDFCNDFVPFVV